jgi:hypothetical protein
VSREVVESVGVSERSLIDFVRQSELKVSTEVQRGPEAYQRCTSLVYLVGIEVVVHRWTNWYLGLVLEEGRHYVSEVY